MTTRTQQLIQRILEHPDVVKQPDGRGEATAWCPWHNDKAGNKPNLGINVRKNVAYCFNCKRGSVQELAEAWGLVDSYRDVPPYQKEIEIAYDYRKPDGTVSYQVIRFKVPPDADKEIRQRRPDPQDSSRWIWDTKGITKILYRLPELRAAPLDEWIFVVEGEKNADQLAALGLIVTTNPGGAKKWLKVHSREMRGRKVAVLRDNDEPGVEHQIFVCNSVHGEAQIVKSLDLGDLPDKGDISDWLDAGHTVEELQNILASTPPYEPPPPDQQVTADEGRPQWNISNKRQDAIMLTRKLSEHGFYVNGGVDTWFFDQDERQLIGLNAEDVGLKILMTDRYQVNEVDPLFNYLVAHLQVEAHTRGRESIVRNFSYYERESNVVLLDTGRGNVLKISADNIEVRENGADGILFAPMADHDPWEYRADAPDNILYDQMVKPVNFSDEGTYTVDEQKQLLLLWILSMAFESLMKTRPLTLAVGPPESGKSSLFRYIGQMLIGAGFDVDSPMQDMKGEEDFWANVSNSMFVCYDDVNANIRWMADALARVATGTRRSKRTLYSTTGVTRTPIRCMLALTAMTPSYALRSGFVASRAIIFTMKQLETKREEYEIEADIRRNRNLLMSDYAKMIQQALQVPMEAVVVADPGLRLADFARVATRIGMGLGVPDEVDTIMTKIRDSQAVFATEEDPIALCLSIWIGNRAPVSDDAQMEMEGGGEKNNGRRVLARFLLQELKAIADQHGMRFYVDTPEKLGKQLGILMQSLSRTYDIQKSPKPGYVRGARGIWWQFTLIEDPESEEFASE